MPTDSPSHTATVYENGDFRTMNPVAPRATTLVARGGRIASIGDSGCARDVTGERIDLQGRVAVPGFVDAHCHLELSAIDLTYAVPCFTPPLGSIEEVCAAMGERARATPEGEWLVGRGNFAMHRWVREGRPVLREDLDRVTPRHPAIVFAGMHSATLNTRALELTGLLHDPPPRGATVEPATGRGTELWDKLALPHPGAAAAADAIAEWGRRLFTSRGVTSIGEIVYSHHGIHAFQSLRRAGRLPVRVKLWMHVPRLGPVADFAATGLESGFGDDWLTLGGIKLFVDGAGYDVWGNAEPAADRQWSQAELDDAVAEAHEAGLQLLIHVAPTATGAEMARRALRRALERSPGEDHRHRIEHLGDMVPNHELLTELRGLGVEVLSTPQFLHNSPEDSSCPLRSLREMGFHMPGNSDCTGTQPEAANPFYGIWCAVARRSKDGSTILPEEALTVDEALRMYTSDAAWADHMDDRGVLAPGRLADLAVLGADPGQVPVEDLASVPVDFTVIGGEIVYDRQHDGDPAVPA
jgi:predicted amidohydrolase YtcJ